MFICYLSLTYKINDKTKKITFQLPSLLTEVAKHVWAKHTKGPGRQEVGKDKRDKVATKPIAKFAKENSRHYGGNMKLMDSSNYLVEKAKLRDLILQKRNF